MALRRMKRVGKKATKFQYSSTYQSIVLECQDKKWTPHMICVAWHRRGRRLVSQILPWLPSPDNEQRGLVIWPEPEIVESTITLYKSPNDANYEDKEWEFTVINVDRDGQRKSLATTSLNMALYASALPIEHELQLKLKPVSRKIKKVLLELSISSVFLKEGKATDDDMISLASMMSISNLSMIGNLEDDDEDYTIKRWGTGGRSVTPDMIEAIPSTEKLIEWAQEVTNTYSGVKISNMTTSWRNGLAFCAIINHYRPELLDFNQLSPQSIKENNRMAFDISKELGIACPLTPNMMLLCDIPDKLAVTAFVYQMYNYFTMSVPSAVTKYRVKESSSPSAAAPFDLTQFDQFTLQSLSPSEKPSKSMTNNPYVRNNISTDKTPIVDESTPVPFSALCDDQVPSDKAAKHEPTLMSRDNSKLEVEQNLKPTSIADAAEREVEEQSKKLSNAASETPGNSSESHGSSSSNSDVLLSSSTSGYHQNTTGLGKTEDESLQDFPVETELSNQANHGNHDIPKDTSIAKTELVNDQYNLDILKDTSVKLVNDQANGGNLDTPKDASTPKKDDKLKHLSEMNRSCSESEVSKLPPSEDRKDFYLQKARNMMKSAGVSTTNVVTFNAFSPQTRQRLHEARKLSVESRDKLSGSLKQILNEDESSTTPKQRQNEPDNKPRAVKTTDTNTKSPRKMSSQKRSSGHSLILTAPSSRPSAAAKRLATKPPDDAAVNDDRQDVKEVQLEEDSKIDGATQSEDSSAWVTHKEDLDQDILMTQSDYVKNELLTLQQQLKPLEERALGVEKDLREAMAKGDGTREDLLTIEYFKLLNEKNGLIKKQMELNYMEKEEDLEKRQFFINRELRPLLAIQEDQKTEAQQKREQELLDELVVLINEREWLDQRLTNTTHINETSDSDAESSNKHSQSEHRTSLSLAKHSITKNVLGRERSKSLQKDCILS